jgi:hypothetical protein
MQSIQSIKVLLSSDKALGLRLTDGLVQNPGPTFWQIEDFPTVCTDPPRATETRSDHHQSLINNTTESR